VFHLDLRYNTKLHALPHPLGYHFCVDIKENLLIKVRLLYVSKVTEAWVKMYDKLHITAKTERERINKSCSLG